MAAPDSAPVVAPAAPRSARARPLTYTALSLAVLLGIATGLGGYTFYYAEGASYFSNDPASCANCHIMRPQFDAWIKSSHHAVATCNDCHAPHDAVLAKLYVKGVNGARHSWAFTTGGFPEPIRMTDFNRAVTESACRFCHADMVHAIEFGADARPGDDAVSCIRCHRHVGHP